MASTNPGGLPSATHNIAEIGSEFDYSDLTNNPPLLYVDGVLTEVNSWTHTWGDSEILSANCSGKTYNFYIESNSLTRCVAV